MAVDFRRLVDAGVHFGHQTYRWCPKMKPYIWGSKDKVYLIDVLKTAHQIEVASKFLHDVAAEGKQVLWIGTKKSAQKIIQDTATKLDMPYVNHRWVGGTLSNNSQIKKSLTKWMHLEDVLAKSEKFPFYTKKELNIFRKMVQRLEKSVGGLKKLNLKNLGAVVIVDVDREYSALLEATGMHIPVIGLVDTNSDPSLVDYVIPANDDSARSIQAVFDYLSEAVEKGEKVAVKKAEEAKAEAAKAKKEDVSKPKAAASKKKVTVVFDGEGKKAEKVEKELKTAEKAEKKTVTVSKAKSSTSAKSASAKKAPDKTPAKKATTEKKEAKSKEEKK